jgi:hypothetical protein
MNIYTENNFRAKKTNVKKLLNLNIKISKNDTYFFRLYNFIHFIPNTQKYQH